MENSNNKVIWTVPTGPSYGGPGGADGSRGFLDSSQGQYGAPAPYGAPSGPPPGAMTDEQKKSDDKKKMMMGAAGGVAVGAVGGMLLANALDDSDDEHRGGGGGGGGGYGEHPAQQYPPMGGPLPDETRSGSSVSSSDKEDVEEARREYEEAYEETYGSD